MKGIIFDIKHFAVHDGPGIRTTVFLKGCPLNCWWCHNPESQKPEPEIYQQTRKLDDIDFSETKTLGYTIDSSELIPKITGDKVFHDESSGGVTFSGGEPLLQFNFLSELLEKSKKENIHTAVDTTGYASPKIFRQIAQKADLFLFDLKIIDSELHEKYTGVPTKPIINNLRWLDDNNIDTIIRFPVIPNITNTKENISQILVFLESLQNINRIDILPYHNISNAKYKRFKIENKMENVPAFEEEDMYRLKEEFENIGFIVSIGG